MSNHILNKEIFNQKSYIFSPTILLKLNQTKRAKTKLVSEYKDEIEFIWEKKKNEKNLVNNSLLNLIDIENKKDTTVLNCEVVEYKHFIAQQAGINLEVTPLGISGITLDQDENFLIGKRINSAAQYSNYIELAPSGSIEIDNAEESGFINYIDQLLKELKEETNINSKDVYAINPFCIIQDKIQNNYDIGVYIKLKKFEKDSIRSNEYTNLKFIKKSDFNFLLENDQNIVQTSKLLYQAYMSLKK